MGNGSGNDSVEVTVKGPSTNAIKDTVAKVEQKMKSVNGITNVNQIYRKPMINMKLK